MLPESKIDIDRLVKYALSLSITSPLGQSDMKNSCSNANMNGHSELKDVLQDDVLN